MARDPRLEVPEGAQVNQEEWEQFLDFAGKTHIRGVVRVLSKLPSTPRCEACGGPFGGVGGRLMRAIGRGPSRKNPHWCAACFEESPEGGFVGTVGVLFADVRGSTALGESLPPEELAALMSDFFDRTTKVIVPLLDVGVGIEFGRAYLGHVGTETASDFTVIGDVVNTAARLQSRAGPGQIVMTEELARRAELGDETGRKVDLALKGKAEPLAARILTADATAVVSA